MVNEMNVCENPPIFVNLKKFLQETYGLDEVEAITIVGEVQSLIRNKVKEINKTRKVTIDFGRLPYGMFIETLNDFKK